MRFVALVFLLSLILTGILAPYIFAECQLPRHGPAVTPTVDRPVRGRWFDNYFVVEMVDPTTFAIGEPRYYQGNYSYLIVGKDRAVLFDAGSGNGDLVRVVRALTSLPVTVVPSHLHFDHVGALGLFDHTAMLDEKDLRARSAQGAITLQRYEFLGFADGLAAPKVRVDQWWRPGLIVDLGGRRLTVLHTPGHTHTSLSLYDSERHLLFCGDFIYPGALYAFLPGASRREYLSTTEQLLRDLDPSTLILAAHPDDSAAIIQAPRLTVNDLQALRVTLRMIESGTSSGVGIYPRVFPVTATMRFATGFSWNNR